MAFVPLVTTAVRGPLGIAHLPRMWLRALLVATETPIEMDRACANREDELDARFVAFFDIADGPATFLRNAPPYIAWEGWIAARLAEPQRIAAWNSNVARETSDGSVWAAVHASILQGRAPSSQNVPAISSSERGPLGAIHLPRLWLKALLRAHGRLPDGYRSGAVGLDDITAKNLGFDADDAISYITQHVPTYEAFEKWVQSVASRLDGASIAAHNEAIETREKPLDVARNERAELGIADARITRNIALNDLLDWQALHRALTISSIAADTTRR
jgi:hypothetical protein